MPLKQRLMKLDCSQSPFISYLRMMMMSTRKNAPSLHKRYFCLLYNYQRSPMPTNSYHAPHNIKANLGREWESWAREIWEEGSDLHSPSLAPILLHKHPPYLLLLIILTIVFDPGLVFDLLILILMVLDLLVGRRYQS